MDIEELKKARDAANQIQESDIQAYILKNQKKTDPHFLRLVADQWIARQKARYKLPTWFANKEVIYPAPLSVEQSSSEITATYKAEIFAKLTNTELIDLTGGMGADTTAFARYFKQITYIERNEALIPLARHNFEAMGYNNIEVVNTDAVSFLNSNPTQADTYYYIDPARRDASKNKVFRIEDCEPDVLSIRHLLGTYLIKYSPILDIKLALEQLKTIAEVHVVAVENEVKELLFLSNGHTGNTDIICINFLADGSRQRFSFSYRDEQQSAVDFSLPKQFVYEPNAAILKAGAFKSLAVAYGLEKLAPNSHLYTADVLISDFPGRSFTCLSTCKFDKREIMANLPGNKANVSTRNFPMKPDEIKKKMGIKDGGDIYLFATENYHQQKIVLICRKAFAYA
jgi:hypothetical protein